MCFEHLYENVEIAVDFSGLSGIALAFIIRAFGKEAVQQTVMVDRRTQVEIY